MWIKIIVTVVAALALTWAAAYFAGARRWGGITRELHQTLDSAESAPSNTRVQLQSLDALPPPVQRYLRLVLSEGQPVIRRVRIVHEGTFNMAQGGERWFPFDSRQMVTAHRPGFDWDGTVRIAPGVPIRVHDAYAGGAGLLQASLFGLVDVAHLAGGGAIAEGKLMRWLAEAAWYPPVLLPGGAVRWRAVDDTSAEATVTDGDVSVTLLVRFGADGLIEGIYSPARGRSVDGRTETAPWEGRFRAYAQRGGMQVPTEGEVGWHVDGRWLPYWRGRIVDIAYEFAE